MDPEESRSLTPAGGVAPWHGHGRVLPSVPYTQKDSDSDENCSATSRSRGSCWAPRRGRYHRTALAFKASGGTRCWANTVGVLWYVRVMEVRGADASARLQNILLRVT